MEKQTIFRKVKPDINKLELDKVYFGLVYGEEMHSLEWHLHGDRDEYADFFTMDGERVFFDEVDWILEEVELPSKEEITEAYLLEKDFINNPALYGANYILNLLK